ncbi:methylmalonyl Co-A mutase-associated GTPase MeaB [Alkalicoccus daliensis]|uniref:LAO/AO transport system kinase n=1 Tax=Alkalicoccus daliensis TaxID=745820 RepID=A0A1H0KCR0_9BACI|nr:methylmalonyl Co-A mutase-associated GTPase MeaB [Alkalicoccus daliensis]SDO53649.1 LAO/AO transport system kinase [Alkalicoccus daliensis]
MDQQLIDALLQGQERAVGKAISIVENRALAQRDLMKQIHPYTGKAQVIGITGSPGAGKSSLVNHLLKHWRRKKEKVAVLAVDPTSPFSGGALLGDRIRMHDHDADKGVFIRSMGTRGSLGGLSEACQDSVRLLDAAGYDRIIIETVGVGQSELDIMKTADTVALVLYPSGGDIIQAFKAGIMEIADIFIINKADLPGVTQLRAELEDLLHISAAPEHRKVVETVSTTGEGTEDAVEALHTHHQYLESSGEKQQRRRRQLDSEVKRRLTEKFHAAVAPLLEETLQQMENDDPYELAEIIYETYRKNERE